MENAMKNFEAWKAMQLEDPDLTSELAALEGDKDAIFESFYKDLEFGTGGLRGIIGVGTNRMNIYTGAQSHSGLKRFYQCKLPKPLCGCFVRFAHQKRFVCQRSGARVCGQRHKRAFV